MVFEPFFGLDIAPDCLLTFRLAFHLPYHALRLSKKAQHDPRSNSDGSPLRQVCNVSFLDLKDSGISTFLYEAQISCVVAGPDEWRWIAYCFVDTYFEVEKRREAMSLYYKNGRPRLGVKVDPFTCGETLADGKFQNPREYFLTVLRYRLEQVKNEWIHVVEKLEKNKREYEQIFLSHSRRHNLSKFRDFVTKARWLSKKLSLDLSKTIDSCEEFCSQPAVDFQSTSEFTDPRPLLKPIRTILDELKSQQKTLESIANNWEDFTRDLEVHLNSETIRISQMTLSIMLFISPIALAAAIFSMDREVIPFIPQNFKSFLCMILIFGAMGALVHVLQSYQFVRQLYGLLCGGFMCWDPKFAAPNLKSMWHRCVSMSWRSTERSSQDEENGGVPPPPGTVDS